jgi:23S rRNA pseudouridine1911/1915/1917 synthase
MPAIEFLADRSDGGKSIAQVLRQRFRLPWSQVKRLIERGHIRVAGFTVTDPGHRVKNRNRVWIREGVLEIRRINVPKKPTDPNAEKPAAKPNRDISVEALPPELTPDCIIYSDNAVVVANKPPGFTTMRHAKEAAEFGPRGKAYLPKTFADWLPVLLGEPSRKVIAVHRIDRDTSGLVVFAKTKPAAEHLTQQFRKHTVERRYLALVRGTPKSTRIESFFVEDRGDGRRGSGSTEEPGKKAVTFVKLLEQWPDFALVECRLETGRTHQVRIHLGEFGTPLCGETIYDRPINGAPLPDNSGASRPMLHAVRLGFVHPVQNDFLTWDISPPSDFAKLQKKLSEPVLPPAPIGETEPEQA